MQQNLIDINSYNFFIFDLDNTLYDEKLYLFHAYKQISVHLANQYGLSGQLIEKYLTTHFEEAGRGNLFNKLCAEFNIPEGAIKGMLFDLRTVQIPQPIELYKNARILLETIAITGKNLFVITNGNPQQQQNKINSIHWHGLKEHIEFVFASAIKPKPDRAPFDYLAHRYNIDPAKAIYIGDTETDREFSENCGISFLNAIEILKEN
jgi:FMN phosphatase YigB (HAD superfamily)